MTPKKLTSCHKNQFTVVELMVVIAVVAVLFSLLGPSLKKILKVSHSIECQSKLKVINTGHLLYTEDFQHTPNSFKFGAVLGDYRRSIPSTIRFGKFYQGWPTELQEYTNLKGYDAFCPNDKETRDMNNNNFNPNSRASYDYRHAMLVDSILKKRQAKLHHFRYPNKQIVFHDRSDWHGIGYGLWNRTRGLRTTNVAYIDGHVSEFSGFTNYVNSAGSIDPHWFLSPKSPRGWNIEVCKDDDLVQ